MSSPSAASRRPQTFLEGVKSSLAKVFFRVLMGSQRFLMAAAAVLGPICVLLALGLITTVTYHYFVSIMPYYLESGWLSLEGLFHATIAVWIVFNLVFNYVMAIYTPPGSPSVATQKPMSAAEAERAPYCRKCEKPKPARSHHCSICKKCILRMDHHCPWVANCVGHNNHRYFVLFLVYMTAGTFYVTLVALIPFKILFVDEEEYPVPMVDPVTVKFSFVLCLSIMVSVGSMMIWHLYLVATQQTTIEFYDNLSDSREYRRRKMVWRNPYDEGLKQNFDAIFGRNSLWWRWLLPSTRPLLSEEGNFVHVRSIIESIV